MTRWRPWDVAFVSPAPRQLGAVGDGVALMAGPNSETLPLPVAALAGSPFASYVVPGAILFAVRGLGPLAFYLGLRAVLTLVARGWPRDARVRR